VSDLCFTPACELADLIHTRKLSARELMRAHLGCAARARARSRSADPAL
jgi:hypothetical protein